MHNKPFRFDVVVSFVLIAFLKKERSSWRRKSLPKPVLACCVFISVGRHFPDSDQRRKIAARNNSTLIKEFSPNGSKAELKIAENISFIRSAVLTHIQWIDISTKTPQKREFHSIHVKDRSNSAVWLRVRLNKFTRKPSEFNCSQQLCGSQWVREHRARYQSVNINTWITDFQTIRR